MPKPVMKEGKVVYARGKFYAAVGRTRQEIPATLVDPAALKGLAGQSASFTYSGKSLVGIGKRPGPIIVCYIPAPDLTKVIFPDVQKFLQKKYTEAGILPG